VDLDSPARPYHLWVILVLDYLLLPRRNIPPAGGLDCQGLSVAYGEKVDTPKKILPDAGKMVPMLHDPDGITLLA
jgi:hypothetical protein